MAVASQAAAELESLLGARVDEARERSRKQGRPVVASATVALTGEIDVAACVFASRRAEERYFVWEQPDRERFALGGLGAAATVNAGGSDRFGDAAEACRQALRDAAVDLASGAPGEGPLWLGGFAFAPDGGRTPEWGGLPAALLVLPELTLARSGDRVTATANVVCNAGSDLSTLVSGATSRLASLRTEPMPLLDPDPVGGFEIASVLPPGSYEQAVGQARERIAGGELEKVVLAREVRVSTSTAFKPAAVFDGLRTGYPSCYCYCVGTPETAFLGASPELLVRREGSRLSTVALAGSARRSADPAVDDHLGERLLHSAKDLEEHRIVAARIERALDPLSIWVTPAPEPGLVKVANIQHLATPIRAQLRSPLSAVELAGALHPTPAVGGEPWVDAERMIGELEDLDRGWYAAPVGWMDATEDGEFCVALRCALVEGRTAHCYAGVGVVADSDPEAELAETEVKLQALLAALTGS